MHPTIPQQLAEAHVADLHRAAQQRREARTARQARRDTATRNQPTLLGRLLSQLTSRKSQVPPGSGLDPRRRACNRPGIDDHLMQLTLEEK